MVPYARHLRVVVACLAVGMVLTFGTGQASAGQDGNGSEERFVLVWSNAQLRVRPKADAPFARAFDYARSEQAARLDWVWPMKVIDTAKGGNDGFIEIETPGRLDTAAHCYDGLEELSGLRIRLFVHQSELALTTMRATKARSVTFPDGISAWRQTAHLQVGSEVSLAPGIALLPQGPPTLGRFLAGAGDFSLSIQMDDVEGTGPSYEAVVGPRKPAASETIHLPMGTQGLFLVVPAFDRRMLRGKAWATIRPRCLETRLPLPPGDRAARKQHPRGKPVDVGFLGLTNADARVGGASASAALPRVRSGATAYWPDGGMAGTVVEERRFFARAKASGARSCFLVAVRGGWPATEEPLDEYFLTLCFDPSDLVLHRGAQ